MFYTLFAFLFLVSSFSLYFCLKFAIIIIKMQEVIEESLDVIDEKYSNLSKILEIPLFYNNTEIKNAIKEVQETRDVLLYIANQLVEDKKTLEEEVSNIEVKKNT
jgi:hypothetical protein